MSFYLSCAFLLPFHVIWHVYLLLVNVGIVPYLTSIVKDHDFNATIYRCTLSSNYQLIKINKYDRTRTGKLVASMVLPYHWFEVIVSKHKSLLAFLVSHVDWCVIIVADV